MNNASGVTINSGPPGKLSIRAPCPRAAVDCLKLCFVLKKALAYSVSGEINIGAQNHTALRNIFRNILMSDIIRFSFNMLNMKPN